MKRLLRFKAGTSGGNDEDNDNNTQSGRSERVDGVRTFSRGYRSHDSYSVGSSLDGSDSMWGDEEDEDLYFLSNQDGTTTSNENVFLNAGSNLLMGDLSISNLETLQGVGQSGEFMDRSTRDREAILSMFPKPEKLVPIFEEGVKASNHRYHLKVYPDCFVASKAVDFLVERHGLTRKEAVSVGKLLQRDYRLFEHVCQDHMFMDRKLYFRYIPPDQRIVPISDVNVAKSMTLVDIGDFLEKGVVILNRRYHLKYYKSTFVGSEAVDFLVTNRFVDTRMDAVKLGRIMFKELNLFEHSTNDKPFEDDYFFYRFIDKSHRRLPNQSQQFSASPATTLTAAEALMAINGRRSHQQSDDQDEGDDDKNRNSVQSKSHILIDAAMALEDGVLIKDYKWRTQAYKDVFVASNAVDFMIDSSLAETRRDAVKLGREMAKELNLFEHVTGQHEFSDDYLFFRFTDDEDRTFPGDDYPATPLSRYDDDELQKIADALRQNLKVGRHRYRTRVYPNTFVGSEAVDYLFCSGYVDSRRQGVKLGRKLASKFHLFRHVTGDHVLKDEHLFYRFCSDDLDMSRRETAIENASRPIEEIARAFRQGIKVSTHKYHLRSYKDTFLGNEAVDFIVKFTETRNDAILIGHKLQNDYNLFDHVAKEHELKDESLFYRFNKEEEFTGGLNLVEMNIGVQELRDIARDLEANIELRDNRNLMRIYRNTFVGREAVDYLVTHKQHVCKSRLEAVQVGRAIARKFHLFEHVTRDFDFCDDDHFFQFNKPKLRSFWIEEERVQPKLGDISQEGVSDKTPFRNKRYNLIEDTRFHSITEDLSSEFNGNDSSSLLGSEELWKIRATAFEDKVKKKMMFQQKLASSRRAFANSDNIPVDYLQVSGSEDPKKALLQANGLFWMSTFRKTDPRYQILKFFTEVSQRGADNIEETGLHAGTIAALAKYFYRASVFTVWRPTSFEAIKKMMLGTAVGKGLDIKGKSAKRGKLSAFVPFLQISKNTHKRMVKKLPKDGVIRIFFSGDARGDRDIAAEKLEAIADAMLKTVAEAKEILADKNADKEERRDAKASLSLDMRDPSISYIDEYSPEAFGIEIPSRLFWEAYVVRQDITREHGSMYDTGRPSQPAFQDMNFAALLAAPREDTPRAVLYQNADEGSPMNPFELLMAYEENDRVKPVVSDFDCFLVGTRGVRYETPLPNDQMDTLKWCVNEIQGILDGPLTADGWTNRWLDVLKDATSKGFHPDFPRFGFGGKFDPSP